ncbi:hypothetical protein AB0L34_16435 [Micromonospora sp. NPDC052213]|uniref:hypothetical protein n=1 Tax=Micromonospora sp. NPDC052213 TaxID=3155812 RepID=UPI00343AFD01
MSDSPSGAAGWQPHPPTPPAGPPGAPYPPGPAGSWPGHPAHQPPPAPGPYPPAPPAHGYPNPPAAQPVAAPYPPSPAVGGVPGAAPIAAGPYPPAGQPVAHPAATTLPPAGPAPAPPRRSTGLRVFFVVLAGLLAMGLCAGGGIAGYVGWWAPRQDMAERRAIFADWGRPHSFTSDGLVEGDDATLQVYRFTCPQGRCPVDLGERVHEWLVAAGAQDAKIEDVTRCVAQGFQYGGPTCTWTWRVKACRATATTTGLDKVPLGWDRPLVLNVRIRECD